MMRQLYQYCTHFRNTNKVIARALSINLQQNFSKGFLYPSVHLGSMRKYGEWAPNVVKSPHPQFVVPNQLLHEFIWSKCEQWQDLSAVTCGLTGRTLTYSQLRKLCRRLATSFLKEGFKAGDVVALVLPNMPEFPVIALGLIEAGLVLSPINPAYTADEIAYQIENSSSVAVITIPDKVDTVLEARSMLSKEIGSKLRIICSPDVLGNEAHVPKNIEKYSSFISDKVDVSAFHSLKTAKIHRDDVAFIPYSSGTTGKPKGVCLTHSNLISSFLNVQPVNDFPEPKDGHQEVVLCLLPSFHIYGFTVVMGNPLFCGAKLVMLPKFEENSFLNALIKYEPTVLYVAPPLVIYLGNSPNVTKQHLKSLKFICSGAAPCSDSDIQKCIVKSPSTLIYKQGYGLTETSPVVCLSLGKNKKYSSVGPPISNTTIKVADLETGQALGPNDEGEICVKGPQVMKGYLNNDQANKEVFDSEGWFHTGDIGYYDDEGDFYITDRLKELIKVKGFQVAPAELEAVLRSHPEVEDAGVIGVPDPRKGEAPIGFIKTKKGSTPKIEDLKSFLAQKVAKFKQIDTFIFVDTIPKSASGKILRKNLKESYIKNSNL